MVDVDENCDISGHAIYRESDACYTQWENGERKWESAENEANHLIESSDDDKDRKLSFDEIIAHHDVFVGSEATEFGEQLQDFHKYTDEL